MTPDDSPRRRPAAAPRYVVVYPSNYRYYHHRFDDGSRLWWWFGLITCAVLVAVTVYALTLPPVAATAEASAPASAPAAVVPPRSAMQRISINNTRWRQVSRGTYDIGDATFVDPATGKAATAHGFVHMIYAADYLADADATANSSTAPAVESCSVPLAAGLKWDATFKWIVDPTNSQGISRQLAVDALWSATNEFERRLSDNVVTGQDVGDCADGIDLDSPDGKNEYMFVFIDDPGVLAFMAGWVVSNRLVNVDIAVNLEFDWGDSDVTSGVFDLFNINSHEVGHAYGMGHISTSLATMQPTASAGETHKRDLLECEQIGLCTMYDQSPTTSCTAFLKPALAAFVDVGSGSRCEGTPSPSSASSSTVSFPHSIAIVSATVGVIKWT